MDHPLAPHYADADWRRVYLTAQAAGMGLKREEGWFSFLDAEVAEPTLEEWGQLFRWRASLNN